MTRETRFAKATRLVREGKVDVLSVHAEDYWSAVVEGDTDVYLVERTPEGRFCECPHGANLHGGCSHYVAADSATLTHLMEREAVA